LTELEFRTHYVHYTFRGLGRGDAGRGGRFWGIMTIDTTTFFATGNGAAQTTPTPRADAVLRAEAAENCRG